MWCYVEVTRSQFNILATLAYKPDKFRQVCRFRHNVARKPLTGSMHMHTSQSTCTAVFQGRMCIFCTISIRSLLLTSNVGGFICVCEIARERHQRQSSKFEQYNLYESQIDLERV
jgi:hypothetical protein